jgi:adenylosuccinate synthase
LARKAHFVVRYQGGNNAGHTVIIGDEEFKLHLIPSGILSPGKTAVMAAGTVIDPLVLADELEKLEQRGVDVSGYRVSGNAHVIMPYHCLLDRLEEERRGEAKIGTTCRGIGPAYVDKAARCGIRMYDLFEPARLRGRLERVLTDKNALLTGVYGHPPLSVDAVIEQIAPALPKIEPYVADTASLLSEAVKQGKNILFEGAQGTFLDLDYGTYPFVTSSHPIAGGACLGTGIGPSQIDRVIGVTKAYTTRVGAGTFPTELNDAVGDHIREKGKEYGTTTGRPRRCGWLDAVLLRSAAMINGLDAIAVTRLDILDELDKIDICIEYSLNGRAVEFFPADIELLPSCTPVWEQLPGWQQDTSGARTYEELPLNARRYLEKIGELCGVKVAVVCVGPRRHEAIVLDNMFP